MDNINNSKTLTITPYRVTLILTLGAVFLALLGIAGWISGFRILASFDSRIIPMAPSTAVCFLLLNFSLLLLFVSSIRTYYLLPVKVISGLVIVYGLITFITSIGFSAITPDDILFPDLGNMNGKPVGKMSPSTGFVFVITGISLFLIAVGVSKEKQRPGPIRFYAGLLGGIVSFLGLIFNTGYALGNPLFYRGNLIPMALTTSLCFMLLGASLFITAKFKGDLFSKKFSLRNLKIYNQLTLGMGVNFVLVVMLGATAWFQADSLWQETKGLYEHPLTVRRSLERLHSDVLIIRINMDDLILSGVEAAKYDSIKNISNNESDAMNQFAILYDRYLGPKEDIDKAQAAFNNWKTVREETMQLIRTGKKNQAIERMKPEGIDSVNLKNLLEKIQTISKFAINRGDKFYMDGELKKKNILTSLLVLLAIILFSFFGVIYLLLKNIREPLKELTTVAHQFKRGNLDTRSQYKSINEFGVFSNTFNSLAKKIQTEILNKESARKIAEVILKERNLDSFCSSLLEELISHTKSTAGIIYFLNELKMDYICFKSIGLNEILNLSFSVNNMEAALGISVSKKDIEHIRNGDPRIQSTAISSEIKPYEVILIPICSEDLPSAIVYLSNDKSYPAGIINSLNEMLVLFTACVNNILSIQKNFIYSERLKLQYGILENQKKELAKQSTELAVQSAELIQQNLELERQKRVLIDANKLKTNFLANMSHELRTPLNSIIALSGVLSRRVKNKIPETEYGYLEVIEKNGRNLLSIINDILDISRIEAGKGEIEVGKYNLNALISEIVNMIMPQAVQKDIDFVHKNSGEIIEIESDADKCAHILQNIISNAVKFTEKGKVEVFAKKNSRTVEVAVIDTGIGISDKNLSVIFDEFQQAEMGTGRRFGGTGLGLAIAKKYATLLKGKILVDSVPGKGSTFTLTLPLSIKNDIEKAEKYEKTKLKVQANLDSYRSEKNNRKRTILLVDDNESAIIQLKDILEETGYNILVAHSGEEALLVTAKEVPDAMILDLMMPGIDGFQVLKKLRESDRTVSIPVLILTAKLITKEELRFLKGNNIHELIQKGDVNKYQLLGAVDSMVNSQLEKQFLYNEDINSEDRKQLILIVEDNPDNMISIKALFDENYELLEAVNGKQGLEMVKIYKPDLVLMDINLPEMDGFTAFRAIRENPALKHIQVIAITASALNEEREEIMRHGFDGYISKPINIELFLKTIHEVLDGKKNS